VEVEVEVELMSERWGVNDREMESEWVREILD
jgi:hypothetical protein